MYRCKPLLQSIHLPNGIKISNRFVLSPMIVSTSTEEGYITREDLAYVTRRFNSAGMQVTGAIYIEPYDQLFEYGFNIGHDAYILGLTNMASTMKQHGSLVIIQLAHAGHFSNQAILNFGKVYGPSPMALHSPVEYDIIAMSHEKTDGIIQQYRDATLCVIRADFDDVGISIAQRLLIQTSFSTFPNRRTDHYGADSLKDHARLCLEVMRAVQEVIDKEAPNNFVLGFRATPEKTGGSGLGYTIDKFNQLINWVMGISDIQYLAITNWGRHIYQNTFYTPGDHFGRPVNQIAYKHLVGRIPLIASGGINSSESALDALQYVDTVGMPSPFATESDFVHKLAEQQPYDINLEFSMADLEDLAIPHAAFRDIVEMMDCGEGLEKHTRDALHQLKQNYHDSSSQNYFSWKFKTMLQ